MKTNFKNGFTQIVDFGFVFENASKSLRGLVAKLMSGSVLKSQKSKTFSKPKFTTGFTIAEIVVVVGIMALLTTLVYTSLDGSKKQSRDQKRVGDISSVQLALEQFYARNKYYPSSLSYPGFATYLPSVPSGVMYAPLNSINSPTNTECGSYHLYITLESKISVLDSKKGFNSLSTPNCVSSPDNRKDASAAASPLIYDVTP